MKTNLIVPAFLLCAACAAPAPTGSTARAATGTCCVEPADCCPDPTCCDEPGCCESGRAKAARGKHEQ